MNISCAPMEGLTNFVYRNAHHRRFGGADLYMTPFLALRQEHTFQRRELRDILPEHNEGTPVVPQVLTKSPRDFHWAAQALSDLGYSRIDLNLGCPSGTVVAKGKGAGLLASPEPLDRFLEEIFTGAKTAISVKTRLGLSDPAEFPALLAVMVRYPIAELTIHPRVRSDFYRGPVHLSLFQAALSRCPFPVRYNGNLFSLRDVQAFSSSCPQADRIMLGRGLMRDPALARRLSGGPGADREELLAFHQDLYEGYAQAFQSRMNAVTRMKEQWSYLIGLFSGGEKHLKALKKASAPQAYESAVSALFQEVPLEEARTNISF